MRKPAVIKELGTRVLESQRNQLSQESGFSEKQSHPKAPRKKTLAAHIRETPQRIRCCGQTSDLQNGEEITWSVFKSLDLWSSERKWMHRCP